MSTEETPPDPSDQGITVGTTAVFSMKQAAEVAGISVSTLRRRRDDLVTAGAHISPDGWRVPVTALVACGLLPGEGPHKTEKPTPPEPRHQDKQETAAQAQHLDELTAQVRDLEHEVAEWRRRAEVAEARAEERGRALDALRIANETERMALRMLTAGTSTAPPVQQPRESTPSPETATPHPTPSPVGPAPASPPDEPGRKGFLSRVLGL